MSIQTRTVLAAFAIAAAVAPAQLALAQGAPVELRYASSAPPKTVWAMQVDRFAANVAELSKGSMKISAFINSQLGSEQDTIQQIARGRIDMGGYSVTAGSLIVPEISLLNLPFLFKDSAEQDCVLDKHLTKMTADLFAKKGVQFLDWTHVGITNLIGKKSFVSPDELKGLKARAQPTKIGPYLWTAFGANPNPLPVTEWNSAHQTGLVDVADAPMTFYVFAGLNKVAPVLTMTRHLDQAGVSVMNKAVYDKLSPEARKVIVEAGASAPGATLRKEVREFELKLGALHKSQGGTIVELTPEQRDVWRKGMEASWTKAVAAVGGESNAYWKAIQDGIKDCSK
jgi:TRAP-type C4-dicarboxylate transport system substrate-binding protein